LFWFHKYNYSKYFPPHISNSENVKCIY
jgi:hypothetical protein